MVDGLLECLGEPSAEEERQKNKINKTQIKRFISSLNPTYV